MLPRVDSSSTVLAENLYPARVDDAAGHRFAAARADTFAAAAA
jgi:hypothetical protein